MTAPAAIERWAAALARSRVTAALQETSWAIPLLQTVHLLAISAIAVTALLSSLQALRPAGPGTFPDRRELAKAFWTGFACAAATGAVLVIAEPDRLLANTAFQLKLLLLGGAVSASGLTLRDRHRPSRRLAMLAVPLWLSVIVAGQLIGHTGG